jgi:hypothetical protein
VIDIICKDIGVRPIQLTKLKSALNKCLVKKVKRKDVLSFLPPFRNKEKGDNPFDPAFFAHLKIQHLKVVIPFRDLQPPRCCYYKENKMLIFLYLFAEKAISYHYHFPSGNEQILFIDDEEIGEIRSFRSGTN